MTLRARWTRTRRNSSSRSCGQENRCTKLGVGHNDMHGQNFFVDEQGNPEILDLGLVTMIPCRKLMEALGGVSGNDYQLDDQAQDG